MGGLLRRGCCPGNCASHQQPQKSSTPFLLSSSGTSGRLFLILYKLVKVSAIEDDPFTESEVRYLFLPYETTHTPNRRSEVVRSLFDREQTRLHHVRRLHSFHLRESALDVASQQDVDDLHGFTETVKANVGSKCTASYLI